MLAPVNINTTSSNLINKQPSFGSVILSRVVLKEVQPNGDTFYKTLAHEDGLLGVYQSFAKRVNQSRDKALLAKLGKFIPDFRKPNPTVYSTQIANRSSFKKFILTGPDARMARDYGKDLVGAMANKDNYAQVVRNQILNSPSKRIFNNNGDEIALDLIVEQKKGKNKLVDVEVSTLNEISKMKKPLLSPKKVEAQPTSNPAVNNENATQGTFDFFDNMKQDNKPTAYND